MSATDRTLQRKQELEKELLKVERDLELEQTSAELQGDIFEKVLKQIVRTVVLELSVDNRKRHIEDYPITLQASHVMEILDVSQGKAYEIMRSNDCPTFRDGSRMLVPRDLFWTFILTRAVKGTRLEGVVSA